jgi:hypothetical protein
MRSESPPTAQEMAAIGVEYAVPRPLDQAIIFYLKNKPRSQGEFEGLMPDVRPTLISARLGALMASGIVGFAEDPTKFKLLR